MLITFLGTGTSHGIPVINCNCRVCTSNDKKDKRLRSSVLITDSAQNNILIDCGPDFREQALTYKITRIDAVLLTHSHFDHVQGIDDLRIYANNKPDSENPPLKIFGNKTTLKDMKRRFNYIFKKTQLGGGKLSCSLYKMENYTLKKPLIIGNLSIIPVPMKHGKLDTTGYTFTDLSSGKKITYLTDLSFISPSSIELARDSDILVIDGLKKNRHETHFSFDQALDCAQTIRAKKTYLIHFCHEFSHTEIEDYIKEKNPQAFASYDGLKVDL